MKTLDHKLPTHLTTGRIGEDAAHAYLLEKGWRIAARNWRAGRGEIDIIAWAEDRLLVFIEVKTRSSEWYGAPEEAVTAKKQALLFKTAGAYMEAIDYDWELRFDVVAVICRRNKVLEIKHIEDAFFPMG